MPIDLNAVFALSPAEKLQLVQDLWDDLASHPEDVPAHDGLLEELERRRMRLASDPKTASPWDEVQQRIRLRHGR